MDYGLKILQFQDVLFDACRKVALFLCPHSHAQHIGAERSLTEVALRFLERLLGKGVCKQSGMIPPE